MHVIFFDIDGTLLLTGGAGQAAMEAVLAAEFQADRPVEGIPMAGRTDRAIVTDLFSFYGVEVNEERWNRFNVAYLRQLTETLKSQDGLVLPGVVALLQELNRRDDVLLGLLTGNFREGARLKLEHYEIFHFFQFGGFGDVHHHRNDVAGEALSQAVKHHNREFAADRVWVIGDTPADVECARFIGANAIAVTTGSFRRDELEATSPDHLFEDFSDPTAFLSLLTDS